MGKEEEKIVKVIEEENYRINFIIEKDEEYKDISLLYEGIARILYERHVREMKKNKVISDK